MKKMVVFDMDNTVLQGRFIDACAKKYNFRQALSLLQTIDKNAISLTRRTGAFLKGKPVQDLIKIVDEIPIIRDMTNVLLQLKERKYIVGLISDSYELITHHISKRIGADFNLSYELKHIENIATGEVNIPSYFYYSEVSSCNHPVCKTNALRHICKTYDVPITNCMVVGYKEADLCMVRHAGVSVAFCSSSELLRSVAGKTITNPAFDELLQYAQ